MKGNIATEKQVQQKLFPFHTREDSTAFFKFEAPSYVHFIVSLKGRLETFRRFMKNFTLFCLKVLQRVKLVVAYSSFVSSLHEHKDIMKENQLQEKYPQAELIWLDVAGNAE